MDDNLASKLNKMRADMERAREENNKKLEAMGVLGFVRAVREGFGEKVRLQGAISREPPFFVGNKQECRIWWKKVFGVK